MSGKSSSPTEGVVSTPVEVVLRRLQGRLGRVRPALGGAVSRGVLIKTFLWKSKKSVYHHSKNHQHVMTHPALYAVVSPCLSTEK